MHLNRDRCIGRARRDELIVIAERSEGHVVSEIDGARKRCWLLSRPILRDCVNAEHSGFGKEDGWWQLSDTNGCAPLTHIEDTRGSFGRHPSESTVFEVAARRIFEDLEILIRTCPVDPGEEVIAHQLRMSAQCAE